MRIGILGAGGHGKVVFDLLMAVKDFEIGGVFDRQFPSNQYSELPLIGSENDLIHCWRKFRLEEAVVAIGNNQVREGFFSQLIQTGLALPVLIHPSATVSSSAVIGPGTVICGHAFIGPAVVIGADCIVNTGANIDHDCLLADHVHIGPGVNLAGEIEIGCQTFMGIGANVIPGIHIGNRVIIGAGSTVISDVSDDITAVGTPAREIHSKK